MDYSKFKDDSFYYFHKPELFEQIVKTLAVVQTDEKAGKVNYTLKDEFYLEFDSLYYEHPIQQQKAFESINSL